MTTICAQPTGYSTKDAIVSAAMARLQYQACRDNDTDASVVLALVGSSAEADVHIRHSLIGQEDFGKLQCSYIQLVFMFIL